MRLRDAAWRSYTAREISYDDRKQQQMQARQWAMCDQRASYTGTAASPTTVEAKGMDHALVFTVRLQACQVTNTSQMLVKRW